MIIQADAFKLPYADKNFHACVTSPPYWGLRKYDGDQGEEPLGLETTPERHIERMVEVFREVRRVLRDDGVVWLNYGDCFGGSWGNYGSRKGGQREKTADCLDRPGAPPSDVRPGTANQTSGNLMLMPHRLAIALQQPYYTGRIKKEADRVWLAAMIEAEGCVHIHRRPAGQKSGDYIRKNDTYTPGVEVANTNPEIVKRCAALSGYVGGTSRQTPEQNPRRDQTIYRWTIRGDQCRNILREVYPYMVTESKKAQTRIAVGSPTNGDKAKQSWESVKALHNGKPASIDFPPPNNKDLWEPGWIVRNDTVWSKSNPMPESVAGWRWERKRTKTKPQGVGTSQQRVGASEGMGTKPQRNAPGGVFQEPAEYEYSDDYVLRKSSWRHTRAHEYVFQLVKKMGYYCNQEAVRERATTAGDNRKSRAKENHKSMPLDERAGIRPGEAKYDLSGRNPRSVLDVPTAPYKGAHYATFPPKLIAPLIRASVPRRCCPECGQAWAAVVERTAVTDYRPTCECGHEEYEPGVVLDIFGGSGTTGMVAKQLERRWVVMDISAPYLHKQAKVRIGVDDGD